MSVEYGIVKEYSWSTKRGILAVLVDDTETSEELPFSLISGRLVELQDGAPKFIEERLVEPLGGGRGFKVQRGDLDGMVQVGYHLAFERCKYVQGSVKQWSSAHEYNECLRRLKGPYYRVIKRDVTEPWNFEVLCENLTRPELKAQYPLEPDDLLEGCEIQFWNFDHTRPTPFGGYYSCDPGWDKCWRDPRTQR